MVISKAWKDLERYTAKALSGVRIGRGADFSKSLPDVISCSNKSIPRTTGTILAECKYSIYNPWVTYIKSIYEHNVIKIPTKNDILLFTTLNDIRKFITPEKMITVNIKKNIPKYLCDHLNQAREYRKSLSENKIHRVIMEDLLEIDQEQLFPMLPIVVLGKKRDSTRVCYTSLTDLTIFYTLQSTNYDTGTIFFRDIGARDNISSSIR